MFVYYFQIDYFINSVLLIIISNKFYFPLYCLISKHIFVYISSCIFNCTFALVLNVSDYNKQTNKREK